MEGDFEKFQKSYFNKTDKEFINNMSLSEIQGKWKKCFGCLEKEISCEWKQIMPKASKLAALDENQQ